VREIESERFFEEVLDKDKISERERKEVLDFVIEGVVEFAIDRELEFEIEWDEEIEAEPEIEE
jgi:hypothetical protein